MSIINGLVGLPPEILALIANELHLRDLQSLSLTSSSILSATKNSSIHLFGLKYTQLSSIYNKRHFKTVDFFKAILDIETSRFSLAFALFHTIVGGEPKHLNGMFQKAATEENFPLIEELTSPQIVQKIPSIDPGAFKNVFLHTIARLGQKDLFEHITSREFVRRFPTINPAASNNAIFQIAVKSNQMSIVRYMLTLVNRFPRIDPADRKNKALILASRYGHLKMIKLLIALQLGRFPLIDPTSRNNLAIREAAYFGEMEIVDYLLTDEMVSRFPALQEGSRDIDFLCSLIKHKRNERFRRFTSNSFGKLYSFPIDGMNSLLETAAMEASLEIIKYLTRDEIPYPYEAKQLLDLIKRRSPRRRLGIYHEVVDYFSSKGYIPRSLKI